MNSENIVMVMDVFAGISLKRDMTDRTKITGYWLYKKAQLSLTNPRDACENFAWFT